jgi:hypothetical protein
VTPASAGLVRDPPAPATPVSVAAVLAAAGLGSPPADPLGRWSALGAAAVRAVYGVALVAAPGPLLRLAGGGAPPGRAALVTARVLGARHLAQAAASALWPSPAVLTAGLATDLTHASSLLVLADLRPRYRRLAGTDALVASAFAVTGLVAAMASARSPEPGGAE